MDNAITEEWRLIQSLNNKYEASNTGHIRNAKTKKQLREFESKSGYYGMTVAPEPNTKINIRVHQKVAEAFLGKKGDGYVVNHIDGNKKNNNVNNLEYITSSENNIHALRTGLRKPANMKLYSPRGENSYLATITEDKVVEILKYHYKTGEGCRKIAKRFSISLGVANGILSKSRPRWTHIDREKIKEDVINEIKEEENA